MIVITRKVATFAFPDDTELSHVKLIADSVQHAVLNGDPNDVIVEGVRRGFARSPRAFTRRANDFVNLRCSAVLAGTSFACRPNPTFNFDRHNKENQS